MAPLVHAADLDTIYKSSDFIGVNYYGPEYRQAWVGAPFSNDGRPVQLQGVPRTDAAQIVIDPSGLSDVLQSLRGRYGDLPIIITENGAAFHDNKDEQGRIDDPKRIEYLRSHLRSIQDARAKGCNVRGYFVWTLIDTWEWTDGYDPRYGLVYLDLDTQQRIPKSSFSWYSSVIRSGKLPD
jgi:beta-glucosidase